MSTGVPGATPAVAGEVTESLSNRNATGTDRCCNLGTPGSKPPAAVVPP